MKNSKKKCGLFRRIMIATSTAASTIGLMGSYTMATALAGDDFGSVSIQGEGASASDLMGKILGILLTITRYVGVALVVYGVYEVVMSFMQNQPEAKTKGIIMALAGVVMVALKSVLQGVGLVG